MVEPPLRGRRRRIRGLQDGQSHLFPRPKKLPSVLIHSGGGGKNLEVNSTEGLAFSVREEEGGRVVIAEIAGKVFFLFFLPMSICRDFSFGVLSFSFLPKFKKRKTGELNQPFPLLHNCGNRRITGKLPLLSAYTSAAEKQMRISPLSIFSHNIVFCPRKQDSLFTKVQGIWIFLLGETFAQSPTVSPHHSRRLSALSRLGWKTQHVNVNCL